jgi:hypothetical protein
VTETGDRDRGTDRDRDRDTERQAEKKTDRDADRHILHTLRYWHSTPRLREFRDSDLSGLEKAWPRHGAPLVHVTSALTSNRPGVLQP